MPAYKALRPPRMPRIHNLVYGAGTLDFDLVPSNFSILPTIDAYLRSLKRAVYALCSYLPFQYIYCCYSDSTAMLPPFAYKAKL